MKPVSTRKTSFRDYLKSEIIRQVGLKKSVLANAPPVDVASISFAFDNKEVLEILRQRGTILTQGKLSQLSSIEDKLKIFVEKNGEKLKRPVMAFVTFTS